MVRRIMSVVVLSCGLGACAGTGGAALAPPTITPIAAPAPTSPQTVAITIAIPRPASAAASARRALYVSANTQSASLTVNGGTPVVANLTPGAPNCVSQAGSLSCSLQLGAPAGNDVFSVNLYGQLNAAGPVLSMGKASATIAAGRVNSIALTLDGLVAAMNVSLSPVDPVEGRASNIALVVTARDASGATIVGDPYVTPIMLSDSDTSGATQLSSTILRSPADAAALTLTYNGAAIGSAVFAATSGGASPASATLTPQTAVALGFNDYPTFGFDNARDVFNPNSTAITPASIPGLHLAWQAALGGGYDFNTQTQPILATGIGTHAGVLFVGGGRGNVYGYDALSGGLLWTQPTGQETYQCGPSFTAEFGVGGSAVYDKSSRSIYIVGNRNPASNALATNTLYRLDAASGAILGRVDFATPDANWPSLDFSHTSVALDAARGIAYVGTGATCDIPSWRGRVVAISVPSMSVVRTFFPVWNGPSQPWSGGGIWGWGGVALDGSGDVLTGVGNANDVLFSNNGASHPPFYPPPTETSGLGDSFIELSPDFHLQARNQPVSASQVNGSSVDLDVSGTPVLFTPGGVGCDQLAALQGKAGALYIYDTTNIGAGPIKEYQLAPSTYADGFLGDPAYSPATGLLYVNLTSSQSAFGVPGMIAVNPGCGHPSVTWQARFGPDSYPSGISRSVPAVSAGGVVFVGTICPASSGANCGGASPSASARAPMDATRRPLVCCSPPTANTGAVWALDASTGEVLNGGNPLIITSGALRTPPTIDGDWVFVLDNAGNMYGLTLDPHYPAIAARARAVDARSLIKWEQPPNP